MSKLPTMFYELECKLKHKDWRKLVKKLQRKKKRQYLAQLECSRLEKEESIRLLDPEYLRILKENEALEEEAEKIEAEKAARLKAEWVARDKALHSKWLNDKKMKKIQLIELEKQKELIRKEFEASKEIKEPTEDNKSTEKKELLKSASQALDKNATRLPSPPPGYIREEERPKREECLFFMKTGACRFGIYCSREHPYPPVSKTLIFPNMYQYLGLKNNDDYDSDVSLEYSEAEMYQNFKNFYEDIFPEFDKCGEVTQLKVCCNRSSHLCGNVYVQYRKENSAMKAYTLFNGRYYAGKQISCYYIKIENWKSAICGLFWQKRCPKGSGCNFLHVFKNPDDAFSTVEFDIRSNSRNKYESYNDRGSDSVRSRHRSNSPHRNSSSRRSHRNRSRSPKYSERSQRRRSRSPKYSERSHRGRSGSSEYSERSYRSERDSCQRSKRYSRSKSRERHSGRPRKSTDDNSNNSKSNSRLKSKDKKRKKKKRSRSKSSDR